MKYYASIALLLALLLTSVACPAMAEKTEVILMSPEVSIQLTGQSETPELAAIPSDSGLALNEDLAINGTGETVVATPQANAKASISLNLTTLTIGVKEVYSGLEATAKPVNGSTPEIRWSSDDKEVAKVNRYTGKITGIKKGTATIYAKIKGTDIQAECEVTVLKAPKKSKISVSPKNGSLKVGQSGTYKVKFDSGYGGSVTFSSSDTSVAKIKKTTGVVTAVGEGECKITVKTYNNVKKTVSLQVLKSDNASNEKIQKVLNYAQQKKGKPYKQGSFGPDKFDCVGFTYWCYKQVGIKLKDTPTKQAKDDRFKKISYSNLKAGDLVYFRTDDDSKVSHAAIYLGDGEIIHASYTAKKVIISKMVSSSSDYYKRNFVCGRRVF